MAVGETRVVQVRLEEPLPLRAGDHAVVLSYSPVMLIGGGRVLLSRCRRSRELSAGERALLAALRPAMPLLVLRRGWRCRRCRSWLPTLPRRWILFRWGRCRAERVGGARCCIRACRLGRCAVCECRRARRCDGFTGGDLSAMHAAAKYISCSPPIMWPCFFFGQGRRAKPSSFQ